MISDGIYEKIEELICRDINKRGFSANHTKGDLELVVRSMPEKGNSIFIITGFCLPSGLPESDGIAGSIVLANVLIGSGFKVSIITDYCSMEPIKKCLDFVETKCSVCVVPAGEEERYSSQLLSSFTPAHMFAIERPGLADDGKMYSMTGKAVNESVPVMDNLVVLARKNNIPVTAVGDGGNELGMGKIKKFVENEIPNGKLVSAVFPADYLIMATVSDWGAYALASAFSVKYRTKYMLDMEKHNGIMDLLITNGVVDGITGKNEASIDGIPWSKHLEVYQSLYMFQ